MLGSTNRSRTATNKSFSPQQLTTDQDHCDGHDGGNNGVIIVMIVKKQCFSPEQLPHAVPDTLLLQAPFKRGSQI